MDGGGGRRRWFFDWWGMEGIIRRRKEDLGLAWEEETNDPRESMYVYLPRAGLTVLAAALHCIKKKKERRWRH
jgi:hypothetical protein